MIGVLDQKRVNLLVVIRIFIMNEIDNSIVMTASEKRLKHLFGGEILEKTEIRMVGDVILKTNHIHRCPKPQQLLRGIASKCPTACYE